MKPRTIARRKSWEKWWRWTYLGFTDRQFTRLRPRWKAIHANPHWEVDWDDMVESKWDWRGRRKQTSSVQRRESLRKIVSPERRKP